jgi:putative DNA primase/helicase
MAKKTKRSPSTQLSVIAEGRDEAERRYLLLGKGGKPIPNLPPILVDRFFNEKPKLLAELAHTGHGLFTGPAQREFSDSVQNWGAKEPSFRVATKIGWNGLTYVLPDQVFNPHQNVHPVLEDLKPETIAKYCVSADNSLLEDWQENIGKLCLNNSRLMFAVALAFAGPILRFVSGERSGGFQIYGDPGKGKTTAAMVAGSVWGLRPNSDLGFLESWNTTANKVEITALAHNDGLLILDETKKAGNNDQKRIETVLEVTIRVAQQQEKRRLTGAEKERSWRCYFLSTSNFSLDELGAKGGVEVDDADRGRLVDIPLPREAHGIYEDLHGCSSGSELTDLLKARCRTYYGVPIREFLERLLIQLQSDRISALEDVLQRVREQYLRELNKQLGTKKTLERASGRFATVYAAGALAISLGVLDWNRAALGEAVMSCQLDGLKEVPATKKGNPVAAAKEKSILAMDKKLVRFLSHNQAKAMTLRAKKFADPNTHKFGSVPYYIAKHKGHKYWYFTAETLKSAIGVGEGASQYKQSLADRGRLDVSTGGKGGRRFVVERRIFPGKGKEGMKWVHAIRWQPIKKSV